MNFDLPVSPKERHLGGTAMNRATESGPTDAQVRLSLWQHMVPSGPSCRPVVLRNLLLGMLTCSALSPGAVLVVTT